MEGCDTPDSEKEARKRREEEDHYAAQGADEKYSHSVPVFLKKNIFLWLMFNLKYLIYTNKNKDDNASMWNCTCPLIKIRVQNTQVSQNLLRSIWITD